MKQQIAFCINSLKIGGAEMLVIDLVNNWPNEYDIHLILINKDNDLLNLIDMNKVKKIKLINSSISTINMIFQIKRYLKKEKISVCFSHLEKPNKLCLLAAVHSKTIVIPVIHSINIYNNTSFISRSIARAIYHFAKRNIIAISSSVNQYCISNLKLPVKKIVQIDNGVDIKRILNKRRTISFTGTVNFAVLGRMEYVKGFDYMLETFCRDEIKHSKWSLKFIGNGSELENLKRITVINGLDKKVTFLGALKHPFEKLMDIHFIVMPSRREGLPISLLEALSIGIPVIVSDVGVLPEIVKDNYNGYVFRVEDIGALSERIKTCLEINEQNYFLLSHNAKQSVSEYSIDTCITKYISLIHKIQ